ncbi:MAG: hypothetical protein K0S09_338 [Sphingobacteriaceae bacterium]|jgi:hypothetical protein|nr:hypothetical protein [Sphingobacteriaceae bacterium]
MDLGFIPSQEGRQAVDEKIAVTAMVAKDMDTGGPYSTHTCTTKVL